MLEKSKNNKKDFVLIPKKTKAFTLIELIVVIAIISILVLLAMPRFKGFTERAKEINIKNDIKVVETVLITDIIENDKLPGGEIIEKEELEDKVLYDKDGKVDDLEDKEYFKVDEDFIKDKTKSTLGGDFISDDEGNVIYVDDKVSTVDKTEDEKAEDIYMATDADFIWEGDYFGGYIATNESSKGYYAYTGSEMNVKIPHEINGHPMTSYYKMFQDKNVNKVVSDNPNIVNMDKMFYMYDLFFEPELTKLDLTDFDTSNVRSMNRMFLGVQLEELDLRNWDTSKVIDMENMFGYENNAYSKYELNPRIGTLRIGNWNVSNVVNMKDMFHMLTTDDLNLSSWNISSVTNMNEMFRKIEVNKLNLNNWRGFNVENASHMFQEAKADTLSLNGWNTGKIRSTNRMFYESKVRLLDVSNWDNENVEFMSRMFSNAEVLTLNLNNFKTPVATDISYMFAGTKTNTINVTSFDTSNVIAMMAMFSDSDVSTIKGLSGFDTRKVSYNSNPSDLSGLDYMFANTKVSSLDLTNFYLGMVFENNMFLGLGKVNVYVKDEEALNSLELTGANLENVTFIIK